MSEAEIELHWRATTCKLFQNINAIYVATITKNVSSTTRQTKFINNNPRMVTMKLFYCILMTMVHHAAKLVNFTFIIKN